MFTKNTYLNTDKRLNKEWQISHWTVFGYKKYIFEHRHKEQHEEWEISHCTVFVYKKYMFEHRQKIT